MSEQPNISVLVALGQSMSQQQRKSQDFEMMLQRHGAYGTYWAGCSSDSAIGSLPAAIVQLIGTYPLEIRGWLTTKNFTEMAIETENL